MGTNLVFCMVVSYPIFRPPRAVLTFCLHLSHACRFFGRVLSGLLRFAPPAPESEAGSAGAFDGPLSGKNAGKADCVDIALWQWVRPGRPCALAGNQVETSTPIVY
jgi:hypothetical protein